MSTPSDRTLLKMSAARLREQADMLDQIAGEFSEMSRLNEAITWIRSMMAGGYRMTPEERGAYSTVLCKLIDLVDGK